MKTNVFKAFRATLVVALLSLLGGNAMAAPSVSITVNPKPTLNVTTDSLSKCANKLFNTYYNNSNPTLYYLFNIPTEAGVSATYNGTVSGAGDTITYVYNTKRDFTGTALTIAQVKAYQLNAGSRDSVFVRAYQKDYTSCFTQPKKVVMNVLPFPNLNISGGTFSYCALDSTAFSVSGTVPGGTTFTWSLKKGNGVVGTIANASTATPGIKWQDNLTGAPITDTLILAYTTPESCPFIVKQEVTIRPRPKFTNSDTTMCWVASVDLTKRVNVDVVTKAELEYSTTRNFATTMTPAQAAAYAVDSAAFPNGQMFYVRPIAAANACPNVDSFSVTVYSKIGVDLVVVDGSTTTTAYDECAAADGTPRQTMTLRIKVVGGCPTAANYILNLTATGVTNITGTSGVTASGTQLTITHAAANAGIAEFTVSVPVDGTAYTISVNDVAQDGAAPSCNCSRNTW